MTKTDKLPLTIVIITHRNDTKFINSLKSAQIAQSVLVIDNNSDNDWTKLNSKYSFTHVSRKSYFVSFAEIRNYALKLVKTPWVLFLDSDESLGNSFKDIEKNKINIQKIIKKNLYDGVTILRKDVFLGKQLNFGEAGNSKILRMFKTNKGKFVRNVHEIAKISGKVGESQICISHFSHSGVLSFLKDITIYSKMAIKNEKSSKTKNLLKMILYPPLKFLQNYIFKFGFLDGFRGLIYALMMSLHSFFVRIFYFEEYLQENNDGIKN